MLETMLARRQKNDIFRDLKEEKKNANPEQKWKSNKNSFRPTKAKKIYY